MKALCSWVGTTAKRGYSRRQKNGMVSELIKPRKIHRIPQLNAATNSQVTRQYRASACPFLHGCTVELYTGAIEMQKKRFHSFSSKSLADNF